MNQAEILETVSDIIREILNQPDVVITESTASDDIEKWDSLAHVNILMTVERTFKIRFSLGEIKQLQNVGEMVSLVEKHLA